MVNAPECRPDEDMYRDMPELIDEDSAEFLPPDLRRAPRPPEVPRLALNMRALSTSGMYDGCRDMDEMIRRLQNRLLELRVLKAHGWQLVRPAAADRCLLVRE